MKDFRFREEVLCQLLHPWQPRGQISARTRFRESPNRSAAQGARADSSCCGKRHAGPAIVAPGASAFLQDRRLRLRRLLPSPLHDLNDIKLVHVH